MCKYSGIMNWPVSNHIYWEHPDTYHKTVPAISDDFFKDIPIIYMIIT